MQRAHRMLAAPRREVAQRACLEGPVPATRASSHGEAYSIETINKISTLSRCCRCWEDEHRLVLLQLDLGDRDHVWLGRLQILPDRFVPESHHDRNLCIREPVAMEPMREDGLVRVGPTLVRALQLKLELGVLHELEGVPLPRRPTLRACASVVAQLHVVRPRTLQRPDGFVEGLRFGIVVYLALDDRLILSAKLMSEHSNGSVRGSSGLSPQPLLVCSGE